MNLRKITAIIRITALEKVEKRLQELCLCKMSVSQVVGCGEYSNLFKENHKTANTRIEFFTHKDKVPIIVNAILETAHTGSEGDGLIVVEPVETVYRIRTKRIAKLDEV